MLTSKELNYTHKGNIAIVSTQAIDISDGLVHIPKGTLASVQFKLKEGENTLHLSLEEESSADIICVCTTKNEEKISANITAEHLGKESSSSMTVKGVAQDSSTLSIHGKIIIDEKASGSEGYQQLDILMIGEEASGKAIPELAIKNPLVVCSHGASVGGINKEQLYYLQSRGLSKKEAEEIIVEGFLKSTGKHIKNKELYTILQEKNEGEERK